VYNMIPAGVEPHDFEPNAKDIQDISSAKIFIFNGAGVDSWAEKIQSDLVSKGVKTIKMSDNFEILNPLEIVGEDEYGKDEHGDDHEYEESTTDPHIWTNPVMAKKQIQIIRDSLIAVDPDRKVVYESNANSFMSQLDSLDTDFRSKLSQCKQKEVVTSHNFLQYLSREYSFVSIPINGISPESEPSAKTLAELSDLIKTKNIRYIFTETLASTKLSETLAKEVGAQVLTLNPIEGLSDQDINDGKNYLSVQRENLQNLSIALECK
jgi:zinc transport system substrate-binding protein